MLESEIKYLYNDAERVKEEKKILKWKSEFINKTMLKLSKTQHETNIKMVQELKSKLDLPLNMNDKEKYQLLIDIKEYQIHAEEFKCSLN